MSEPKDTPGLDAVRRQAEAAGMLPASPSDRVWDGLIEQLTAEERDIAENLSGPLVAKLLRIHDAQAKAIEEFEALHTQRSGRVVVVALWYPGVRENADTIEITLEHVRAARGIRIDYDFDRDGYRVLGEKLFGDQDLDGQDVDAPAPTDAERWQEEAFIPAWLEPEDEESTSAAG